jgi:hypothetical protein
MFQMRLELLLIDDRADCDLRIVGIPIFQALYMSGEAFDEFVIDFGIDDDADGAHAALSLMQIPADNVSTHRVVHIGVVQNDAGCVPAELERHALHARTGHGQRQRGSDRTVG